MRQIKPTQLVFMCAVNVLFTDSPACDFKASLTKMCDYVARNW